jgi:hypothetical protein
LPMSAKVAVSCRASADGGLMSYLYRLGQI